jgi:hypothetical protein
MTWLPSRIGERYTLLPNAVGTLYTLRRQHWRVAQAFHIPIYFYLAQFLRYARRLGGWSVRKIVFAFGVGRTVGLFAMACVSLWLSSGAAHAGSVTLWYNGDDGGRNGLLNETRGTDGLIYDDFIVPTGDIYTITGVFSNDLMPNPDVTRPTGRSARE